MKKGFIFICLFIIVMMNNVAAQWQQVSGLPSDARAIPNSFVINNMIYIGGGFKTGGIYLTDFWQYNPVSDTWVQKANLPQPIGGAAGFAINGKGYLVAGWVNGVNSNGVYEYDPVADTWTTKNNFGGAPRYSTCNFVLGNKGYVGLGYIPLLSDFWEYDPVADSWTQKAAFPGGVRQATVHFVLNGLAYVGTGLNNTSTYAGLNDMYTYDAATDTWTPIGSFPGPGRHSGVSFALNGKAYIGTGNTGNVAGTTYDDFWEFNPVTSTWLQVDSLPGGVRQSGAAVSANGCGFVFGGFYQTSPFTYYSDLWRYCPSEKPNLVEENSILDVLFSPNPVTKELVVNSSEFGDIKSIEIYSSLGERIFSQQQVANNQQKIAINVSRFVSGIYFITITDETGNKVTKKFVKM
jgi:N-acetylneuraminic acid mutarotase